MKKALAICWIVILVSSTSIVSRAEEVTPYTTNIILMSADLSMGNGYLIGSGGGMYSGTGLHAIFEVHIQYKTSGGAWYNVDDGRTSRCYEPGKSYSVSTYYYSPVVGTQYRFHVYMRVVDSDGNLHDASVINSSVYTYTG